MIEGRLLEQLKLLHILTRGESQEHSDNSYPIKNFKDTGNHHSFPMLLGARLAELNFPTAQPNFTETAAKG